MKLVKLFLISVFLSDLQYLGCHSIRDIALHQYEPTGIPIDFITLFISKFCISRLEILQDSLKINEDAKKILAKMNSINVVAKVTSNISIEGSEATEGRGVLSLIESTSRIVEAIRSDEENKLTWLVRLSRQPDQKFLQKFGNPRFDSDIYLYWNEVKDDEHISLFEVYSKGQTNGDVVQNSVGTWDEKNGLVISNHEKWERRNNLNDVHFRVTTLNVSSFM